MKKIILVCIIALFNIISYSQTKDEINYIQSIWGMEKKDIVKSHITLTDKESKDFWDVYDKYEDSRKELGKERIKVILEYKENLNNLTFAKSEELIKKMLSNQTKFLELLNITYYQMNAVTSPLIAAQFIQLENYLDTVLKYKIMEDLALIGEEKK